MNYLVTYQVGENIRETVLYGVKNITGDLRRGKGYSAFWSGDWTGQIAEFQDVFSVIPYKEKKNET